MSDIDQWFDARQECNEIVKNIRDYGVDDKIVNDLIININRLLHYSNKFTKQSVEDELNITK